MRKLKVLILGVVFVSVMVLSTVGWAAPVTFDLTYEGPLGSSATGTGFITFDDAVLPNPNPNPGMPMFVSAATLGILDFSLTISGASIGNGTFGLPDIDTWFWGVNPPGLDLSMELVGQTEFLAFNYSPVALSGAPGVGPGGSTIFTNEGTGDALNLIAMTPRPVPTPSAMLLMGTGLLGLIGYRKYTTNKS